MNTAIDPRQHLISVFRSIVDRWTVDRFIAGQPSPPPKNDFNQVPCHRIVLCLSGRFRLGLAREGRHQVIQLTRRCSLYAPPMAWTQEDWTAAHSGASIVFRQETIRFLVYHHPGDGRRLAQPQVWHHTRRPLSAPGRAILEALHATTQPGAGHLKDAARIDLLRGLIRASLDELEHDSVAPSHPVSEHRRAAVTYLEEHLNRPISRTEVAAVIGVHPNHLSRVFRRTDQGSFSATLTALRMARARHYLTRTDLPVEDVAPRCGFSSSDYFIKAFRKAYGVTPGAFRLANGEAQAHRATASPETIAGHPG